LRSELAGPSVATILVRRQRSATRFLSRSIFISSVRAWL
jgi:hypothetical protein